MLFGLDCLMQYSCAYFTVACGRTDCLIFLSLPDLQVLGWCVWPGGLLQHPTCGSFFVLVLSERIR